MTLSRRAVLKQAALVPSGAAISPLLLPFVQRAHADAQGKAPPLRFVFVVKSSGLTPAELVPQEMTEECIIVGDDNNPGPNYRQALSLKQADELIDRPLADMKLHESPAWRRSYGPRQKATGTCSTTC